MLYDLNKKGTIIITIGRSGSHLLGDIISKELTLNKVNHVCLKENFLQRTTNFQTVSTFYKKTLNDMLNETRYVISQIQDFNTKLWILTYGSDWLKKYHVIVLKRNNQIAHFFSKQILENFHQEIPTHTKKGIDTGTFDSLKNQRLEVNVDSVWQFYSDQQLLDRFKSDYTVVYEDMIKWPAVEKSIYLKNNYKIKYEDLFSNYHEVVAMLSQNHDN